MPSPDPAKAPPGVSGNGELAPSANHPAEQHAHVPVRYAPRTRLSVTVFGIIATVGLLVAFLLVHHANATAESNLSKATEQASNEAVSVDAVRVTRAVPAKVLTLPGDARSFYETTIFARTSGYLHKWLVDIGDRVKAGEVLATIDTPELDDQLHEAMARLAELQANTHVAETSAAFAKISFLRWEPAAREGAASAQERDQKKSEWDQGIAKQEAAKSAVNLGEAEVQRLQTLEGFKNVEAPFDGVITQRHIDLGDLVTAGSTTNTTPLFTISQSNRIRVFADVPQPAVGNIHVGMEASATVRELPGRVYRGIVDRTASSIDPRSRTLKVEVLVPNADLALLPGMYVQVAFETNRKDPPLQIPPSALVFGPTGAQVAIVAPDGRVRFQSITIARDLGNSVEVGSGLNGGEMVALNIGNQVVAGERVECHVIAEATTPAASTSSVKAREPTTRPVLTEQTPG